MSEHYSMQLTIGGRVAKGTFGAFCRLFREVAWPSNPIESLDEHLDADGSFYHEEDDCNPAHFDELLEFCQSQGLSFLRRCGSNGVESPEIYFWAPDMETPIWVALTMDGDGYVEDSDLKARLRAYMVSGAEKARSLEELLLPDIPHMPEFEVIDG